MEYFYYAIASIFLVLGLVGCFIPILPGPMLSYCALFCLIKTKGCPSIITFVFLGFLVLAVTISDYLIPMIGAKKFNCSKWGTYGCFIGTLFGMFFLPIGVIAGPFLGALIGECFTGKSFRDVFWGGVGALLGFLASVLLKCFVCVIIVFVVLGTL
jgi:uncharacterized protein YqgC (DUF456 family)